MTGVLVLYFANLLEEIIRSEYVHTLGRSAAESPGIGAVSDDEGNLAPTRMLDERDEELRHECRREAALIVDELRTRGFLEELESPPSDDKETLSRTNKAVKRIFKKLYGVDWGSRS